MPARKSPTIIKGHAAQGATQPVLTGPSAAVGAHAACGGTGSRTKPEITVRKQGELIEAIEITCPCGNHMVIECLYDPTIAEVTP